MGEVELHPGGVCLLTQAQQHLRQHQPQLDLIMAPGGTPLQPCQREQVLCQRRESLLFSPDGARLAAAMVVMPLPRTTPSARRMRIGSRKAAERVRGGNCTTMLVSVQLTTVRS